MTEEIYDPFNTIETEGQKKKRIEESLSRATRILIRTTEKELFAECLKLGSHLFVVEERMYYEIIKRNPKDPDEFIGRLYEYYVCERCGAGAYKLYADRCKETGKQFKSRISVLEAEGLRNVHTRGEVYV